MNDAEPDDVPVSSVSSEEWLARFVTALTHE